MNNKTFQVMKKVYNSLIKQIQKGWVQILCGFIPPVAILALLKVITHKIIDNMLLSGILIVSGLITVLFIRLFSTLHKLRSELINIKSEIQLDRQVNKYRACQLYISMAAPVSSTNSDNYLYPVYRDTMNKRYQTTTQDELDRERNYFIKKFTDENLKPTEVKERINNYCV